MFFSVYSILNIHNQKGKLVNQQNFGPIGLGRPGMNTCFDQLDKWWYHLMPPFLLFPEIKACPEHLSRLRILLRWKTALQH